MALAAVCSKGVALAKLIVYSLLLFPMFVFVLQYFVSFLVLRSSHWGDRAGCLLLLCSEFYGLVIVLGLPLGAMGWSVVCHCDISLSYSLNF